ncbi:hypothetical protein [Nostoc sp.]|uniref:hypothetical protein n=1 Tax=Nostoc sp. TaxID=1180 RepID=UPI002FFA7649
MSMTWQELRDALAKQTGWKIAAYEDQFGFIRELKITWGSSIFYYVEFKFNRTDEEFETELQRRIEKLC